MKIAIVGTGLIGGSMALVLRKNKFVESIIGVDNNPEHAREALALGIVDEIAGLDEAIRQSDMIILSLPVDSCRLLLPYILDRVQHQVVTDTGSIKLPLVQAVIHHPQRNRYVAAHPMWGTEFSGPAAATANAFKGRCNVICDAGGSAPDAVQVVEKMFGALGMYTVHMESSEHDIHVAYVSHISHITSFALANTVLEKEKEEDAIFELASAGFESTVRLAKSSPDMWLPILQLNKDQVLDVLNEHIVQLRKFKSCLEKENWAYLSELMHNANTIKKVLDDRLAPTTVRSE